MKKVFAGLFALLLLGLIVAGGTYWYLLSQQQPVNPKDSQTHIFVIKKGQSSDSIATNLHQKGLIRSPLAFKLALYQNQSDKSIQAGSFRLSPSMSNQDILEALSNGRIDTWVKIIEGRRREEIAQSLETAFKDAGAEFDPQVFLKSTEGKEGYLFPDSYLLPLTASEADIASILENTFNKKITPEMKADIERQGKTLDEIVTMASLIEREANDAKSRRLISGILWKRVANDWPLQVDASLQYIVGYDPILDTWWKPPSAVNKELDSPFNTYKNLGLPPKPIAAPSLDSLKASIYPEESDYWFYITDTKGNMHYSKTLEEHNQNIQTYLR